MLPRLQDHTTDYDRVITMAEMSIDEDEDEDEDDGWCDVDVGDGSTVRLPDPVPYDFHDHVEVIPSASACWSPYGPMSCEMREHICCIDDVYRPMAHRSGRVIHRAERRVR